MTDETKRAEKIAYITKTNRMVRVKYELNEITEEIPKLTNIIEEIKHDLENIGKKRDILDLNSIKLKQLLYPLAIRDKESGYSEIDRRLMTNSKFIEELQKKTQALLEFTIMPEKERTFEKLTEIYKSNNLTKKLEGIIFNSPQCETLYI